MPRRRVLAVAFHLLDDGLFRIGGEQYADENGSYGLVTMERRHVRTGPDRVTFCYVAKAGKQQTLTLDDPKLVAAIRALSRRRGGSDRLLASKSGRRWQDLSGVEVNEYVKDLLGEDVSAKDFRTWHATVAAAVRLAGRPPARFAAASAPSRRP